MVTVYSSRNMCHKQGGTFWKSVEHAEQMGSEGLLQCLNEVSECKVLAPYGTSQDQHTKWIFHKWSLFRWNSKLV